MHETSKNAGNSFNMLGLFMGLFIITSLMSMTVNSAAQR